MKRTHVFSCVIALALALPALGQALVPVKQVVAPPSDIERGIVKLPDPVELGVSSTTTLLEIDPSQGDDTGLIDLAFPLFTGDGQPRVVFLPAEPDAWVGMVTATDHETQRQIEVRTDAPVEQAGVTMVRDPLPWGDPGRTFPAITLPAGQDALHLQIRLNKRVGGFVLLDLAPDRSLYTYTRQLRTLVDEPITLVSSLSDGSRIVSLSAIVRGPGNTREMIEADVDTQELSFTPKTAGKHSVQVIAEYANQDNNPVLLTTQHLIEVEHPTTPLGDARAATHGSQILLSFDDAPNDPRVIIGAELWGKSRGKERPVCWLARVCDTNRSLAFDPQLVINAGVDPTTLELRSVRVHDIDSMVPTQIIERMDLQVDGRMIETAIQSQAQPMIPTRVPNEQGSDSQRGALPGGHRLLLVHGYCSGGNPFTASHFSGDIAIFSDTEVSRSHDAFALEIMSQTSPMKSFGVAAHSQGAMAALHLYTFYFSGLDWARGDRLIQSVGAPYQGTALAGNAAVLGDIFGFGCGENNDMTYAGSASWLSLIPTSSRQQVWYYTTSFEDRPFLYDYCNIITDLLLSDPDDGVIEQSRGQLPGATNMGHTEGWCHTTGMRDPAQCTDSARNSVINARARR